MAIRARGKLVLARAVQREVVEDKLIGFDPSDKRTEKLIDAFEEADSRLANAERKYDTTRNFMEATSGVSKALKEMKKERIMNSQLSEKRRELLKKVKRRAF